MKGRTVLGAAAALVVLSVAVAAGRSLGAPEAESSVPGQPAFPQIGSTAPDFSLIRLDADPRAAETRVRLSDYGGRYVYLDVFGTWCLPCQAKYADSADLVRELESMGVVVLGLLYQDDPDRARGWFQMQGGMHYPFAMLDEGTAAEWGVTGAPMGYLISPEGRVERRCFGCNGRWSMDRLPGFVQDLQARS